MKKRQIITSANVPTFRTQDIKRHLNRQKVPRLVHELSRAKRQLDRRAPTLIIPLMLLLGYVAGYLVGTN